MKKCIFFLGVLLSLAPLSAQSLSPQVIATSGNSLSSSGASIDFTLGEVTIATFTGAGNDLTQGFHQPEIHFFSIDKNEDEFTFSLYPNPTDQFVTVASTKEMEMRVHIFSATGQVVEVSTVFTKTITLDLQTITNGNYILVITDTSGKKLNSYTLIKK